MWIVVALYSTKWDENIKAEVYDVNSQKLFGVFNSKLEADGWIANPKHNDLDDALWAKSFKISRA